MHSKTSSGKRKAQAPGTRDEQGTRFQRGHLRTRRRQENHSPRAIRDHNMKNAEEGARLTRRSFLELGASALGALALLETGIGSLIFLRSQSKSGERGGKVVVGPVEKYPPGSVTEFPGEGFFLLNSAQGNLSAIYRRCPHLGCTVDYSSEDERFFCPCHGSSFDSQGRLEGPPVPRSLDHFPVTVENGQIVVDTSKIIMGDQGNGSGKGGAG